MIGLPIIALILIVIGVMIFIAYRSRRSRSRRAQVDRLVETTGQPPPPDAGQGMTGGSDREGKASENREDAGSVESGV